MYFSNILKKMRTPSEEEAKEYEEVKKEQETIDSGLSDIKYQFEKDAVLESIERENRINEERELWEGKGYDGIEFDADGNLQDVNLSNPHGNHISYVDNNNTRFDNYKLSDELQKNITEFSGKYNIDPTFFKALAIGEQGGNDKVAYSREDNKGNESVGAFQINPGVDNDNDGISDFDQSYHSRYNLDMYNKRDNVELGAIIFSKYLNKAKEANPEGSKIEWYRDALSAYNMGGGYVFSDKKASDKKIKWNNTKYKGDDNRVGYMDKIFSLVENGGGFVND